MSARDGQKGDGQKGDGRNVAAQTRAEESAAGSTAPRAASAGERAPRTFESDANRPPSGPELAGGEAAERPADASPELLQEQAEAAKPEEALPYRRTLKSFVVRGGRLTVGQQAALETLWPRFGLDPEQPLDAAAVFGRHAPLVLEIGFGMGASLLEMAQRAPDKDFIGVEVHPPGVGTLLRGSEERGLSNLRVYQHDAIQILERCLADGQLAEVLIFFPDPWHKKRHHKRRLVQPPFVQLLRRKLRPGGRLHLATDWQNYAEQMVEVLEGAEGFRNAFGPGQYAAEHDRPETKFERRGLRLGHGVWDLIYTRER